MTSLQSDDVKASNLTQQFPLPLPVFLDITSWALHQSEAELLLIDSELGLTLLMLHIQAENDGSLQL
jgi:hypothetical protein